MTKRLTLALLSTLLSAPAAGAVPDACAPASAGLSDLGYASYRDGAAIRGITVDLLEEIHRRSGCVFQLGWYPHGRVYAQFFSGQLDVTGAALRNTERDQHGVWLPYTYSQFELVLLNQSAGEFRSLADFVEHSTARLNVARSIAYSPATQAQMDRLQKLGRLEYVNDYGVVFRKILAGRADGTLAPPAIHVLHQRQFHLLGRMRASTFAESPRAMVGIYVSKQLPAAQRRRYAEAVRAIVGDGTVQQIYLRYLDADVTRQIFAGGVRDILDAMPAD
ncbi:transporter substrate-binding domain-containing protein [Rugamonas sp. FT107W]|uniref:Transporter substrate-binding domain-containing protein n=1 Tax=Duganella vulcania TaxID=2692166 RepID=A0A845HPA8_9BURK|nr:ABC transporter substrate-binding protein [Duganella vulcania]MYN20628.1 transporter substrate-binding domain-containing protein [Duganella vulcania]